MDLQVTYLRDVLSVDSVDEVPNVTPRTLDVRGPNFKNVVKIEINEEEVPSYVIMSKNRVLVQVPESQEKEVIRTIAVLSNDFTKTKSSQVKFELTNQPQKVSGLRKLIQSFLLYLLRTPGTDAWYPQSGGGVQKIVGAHFSKSNVGGVTAAFTTAVSRVKRQLISLQASNSRLSASEKLGSVTVLSAVFNAQQTALVARVELVSQSGQRAIVGLEL
jgi:hypothetical protein